MGVSILKRAVWRGLAEAYHRSGAFRARNNGTVAILTYHRVLSTYDLKTSVVQSGMYVQDDTFRMHMGYLRERFEVLSFQSLLDRWREGQWDPRTSYCVITFDDGWLDNFQYAFPILKQYQLPATIFLPTDYIGTSRWFWPERLGYLLRAVDAPSCKPDQREAFHRAIRNTLENGTMKRGEVSVFGATLGPEVYDRIIEACKDFDTACLDRLLSKLSDILETSVPQSRIVVNWDEVREMSKHGISFGSHSCSHRLLTQLSEHEVLREIGGSYKVLRESGASTVPVFCYPNGNYDHMAKEAVEAAEFEAAVSCDTGREGKVPSDRWALKRISLHQNISESPALLSLAISGFR